MYEEDEQEGRQSVAISFGDQCERSFVREESSYQRTIPLCNIRFPLRFERERER